MGTNILTGSSVSFRQIKSMGRLMARCNEAASKTTRQMSIA